MKLYEIIGGRIKEAREDAGISQRKLGRETGIGQCPLSLYEAGKRKASKKNLLRIAEYLNKPLSFFYSEIPEKLIELEKMGIGITSEKKQKGERTYHLGLPKLEKNYTSLLKSLKEVKIAFQKDTNINEKGKRFLANKCKTVASSIDDLWNLYILVKELKK